MTGVGSESGFMPCMCSGYMFMPFMCSGYGFMEGVGSGMEGVGRLVLDNITFRIGVGMVMTATDSNGIGETKLWYAYPFFLD